MIKLSAILVGRYATQASDGWVVAGTFRQIKLSRLARNGFQSCVYLLFTDVKPGDRTMLNMVIANPDMDDEELWSQAAILQPTPGDLCAEVVWEPADWGIRAAGQYEARFYNGDTILDVAVIRVTKG